jgi:hypothetical protein
MSEKTCGKVQNKTNAQEIPKQNGSMAVKKEL